MNETTAVQVCAALAHDTRLDILNLLHQRKCGVRVGRMAELLSLPPSTLSFHLSELLNADLVESQRRGRQVRYTINVKPIRFAGYRLVKLAS